MHKLKKIFLTTIVLIFSCEPDDICLSSTEDTPRLIIGFYEINTNKLKEVENLKIQGIGNDQVYIHETIDSIGIPLKNKEHLTSFNLTKDFIQDKPGSGNNDKIFINHDSNFIYLSRACGYINNYEINNVVIENDNENWILNSQISSSKIKDEKSIHIKIYH